MERQQAGFGAEAEQRQQEGQARPCAIEVTGAPEKLNEFIDVMGTYGEIDVTRSGAVAIALEARKLRLQPPVERQLSAVSVQLSANPSEAEGVGG